MAFKLALSPELPGPDHSDDFGIQVGSRDSGSDRVHTMNSGPATAAAAAGPHSLRSGRPPPQNRWRLGVTQAEAAVSIATVIGKCLRRAGGPEHASEPEAAQATGRP